MIVDNDILQLSLESTKEFMEKAHQGQKRWGGRPYSIHPEKVVSILKQFGQNDIEILCAGYLHDVLEDTDIFPDEIESRFGSRVLWLVQELTFKDSKRDDQLYYDQCTKLSKDARIIKIADILANLSDGHHSIHFVDKRVKALSLLLTKGDNGSQ